MFNFQTIEMNEDEKKNNEIYIRNVSVKYWNAKATDCCRKCRYFLIVNIHNSAQKFLSIVTTMTDGSSLPVRSTRINYEFVCIDRHSIWHFPIDWWCIKENIDGYVTHNILWPWSRVMVKLIFYFNKMIV